MVCHQIGFIPSNLSNARKEVLRRKLPPCKTGEHLMSMHSYSPLGKPLGIEYYCCSSGCFIDPPKIPMFGIDLHIDPKLIRRILEKGGKFTLDNGNFTLEIIEEKITRKPGTKRITRIKKQKTNTKKVPKKSTKTRITSSKRRR